MSLTEGNGKSLLPRPSICRMTSDQNCRNISEKSCTVTNCPVVCHTKPREQGMHDGKDE